MKKIWRTITLLLGLYSISVGLFGLLSTLSFIGKPFMDVLTYWSAVHSCNVVDPVTPISWNPLSDGILQPNDCIEAIEGVGLGSEVDDMLKYRVDLPQQERYVQVSYRRDDIKFSAYLPVVNFTLEKWLQAFVPLIVLGVFCWVIGMIIILTTPTDEVNTVFTSILFFVALISLGMKSSLPTEQGQWHTALTTVLAPPITGALLLHFALIFPSKVIRTSFLKYMGYAIALIALVMHEIAMVYVRTSWEWMPFLANWGKNISYAIVMVGMLVYIIRSCAGVFFSRISSSFKVDEHINRIRTSWLLLISCIFGAAPAIIVIVSNQFGEGWIMSGFSGLNFAFYPIVTISGTTYVMLKYKTFQYRGRYLMVVMISLVSVSITGVIMSIVPLILPKMGDGLHFLVVLIGATMTTVFWYTSNPVRGVFKNYFLRGFDQYSFAREMFMEIAGKSSVKDVLSVSSEMIQKHILVKWSCVYIEYKSSRMLCLYDGILTKFESFAERNDVAKIRENSHAKFAFGEGELQGVIFLGESISVNPIDESDDQLLMMAGQFISKTVVNIIRYEEIACIPNMILVAEEKERRRIGSDLHDEMSFLATLPFAFGRIERLLQKGLICYEQVIDSLSKIKGESKITMKGFRTILQDLDPQVSQGKLLSSLRDSIENICYISEVSFDWRSDLRSLDHIDDEVSLQIYRIVKQAVSNAISHGKPNKISVSVSSDSKGIMIEVADDGIGFNEEQCADVKGHFGISNMIQRARFMKGEIKILSTPELGTKIVLFVPLQEGQLLNSLLQ